MGPARHRIFGFYSSKISLWLYIMYMRKVITKVLPMALLCVGLTAMTALAQTSELDRVFNLTRAGQPATENPNPSAVKVARLHYSGGGDWYWGRSAVPNFLRFVDENTDYPIDTNEYEITINDPDLFKYPFLFATGHGVISFSAEEKERLRQYLAGGGFLFVNDSYGMDQNFRRELSELFPEREVVQLPFDHPIYHVFYDFPNGPPKIHEHDNKPPRGYSVILNGRAVVYFLVESDIGDGWEDPQVHDDPEEKRLEGLKMGVNVLTYALLY